MSVCQVEDSSAIFLTGPLKKEDTVCLTNYIILSEKQWENYEISLQMLLGISNLYIKWYDMLVAYCVCDVLYQGHPCMRTENIMLQCQRKYRIQGTSKCHKYPASWKCLSLIWL